MDRRASCFALALALSAPSLAFAQSTTRVDGFPWRPELSVDPNATPWVEGTLTPGAGSWNVQSAFEYVRSPLVIFTGGVRTPLVRDQVWMTLGAQIGIGRRMGFAL